MDCFLSLTGNIFCSPSIQLLETSGTVWDAVKELMLIALPGYLLKTFTVTGAQNVFQELTSGGPSLNLNVSTCSSPLYCFLTSSWQVPPNKFPYLKNSHLVKIFAHCLRVACGKYLISIVLGGKGGGIITSTEVWTLRTDYYFIFSRAIALFSVSYQSRPNFFSLKMGVIIIKCIPIKSQPACLLT